MIINEQLYYDEYWDNRSDMRLIGRLIKENHVGASICDIGCGYGELIKKLHLDNFKVLGIDGSQVKVKQLINRGIEAEKQDIEMMNLRGRTFDVVTLLHILEHVNSANKLVEKVYNILNKDGDVYVSVPNGGMIDDNMHVRQFTINKLANLFINHGFEVINIQVVPYLNYENNNSILLHAKKLK